MSLAGQHPIAIYVLTPQGLRLAEKIISTFGADIFSHTSLTTKEENQYILFTSLSSLIKKTFTTYSAHIFISAAGIAVRCIAPHISSKQHDPAVLVIDQNGEYVISLLSGHIGGGNSLTKTIASQICAKPVITTATDLACVPSLDVLATEKNLHIHNIECVKYANSTLLRSQKLQVYDPYNYLKDPKNDQFFTYTTTLSKTTDVIVSPKKNFFSKKQLILHPKIITVGIGCKKGTDSKEIEEFILKSCESVGISPESLACLASIEAKRHEEGILKACKKLQLNPVFFTAEELASIPVTHISKKCKEIFGISGVCEPASLLATGKNATLLLPKQRSKSVTLALALPGELL